ncbi:phosphate ABC transporter substrate-binding protein PstS [Synechococcus sp. Tobar12-5m-g]|jgi:phosphate transport system substrate-binding protein|uniref:phosphate ABC transporter substrate-binding protein PstS n=1 Tax=unclassified Synechococcus TaxID=2626047 RepID=UPI0020CBC06C|nr:MULTISPECIES: phosphate ABC transporter substrate-binding protein PstS [unclassified Synechococcus]MCP9773559.1 phosphate ABC transporter substrate-binding protein PstS [Synechococcus sp. Tobar12-5m-g]MCP9874520.1 phosphate ABC transporter substrate-binding protein PstS [Synechococcus sp. Cruz CV-v-12]
MFPFLPQRLTQALGSQHRLVPISLIIVALTATGCGGGRRLPSVNGAGASFPAPAYQRWASDYKAEKGYLVNYQSVGSGTGVRSFLSGSVDFGATDKSLTAENFKEGMAAKRGALQIPMLGGTISPAYNNPDCPDLKLTQAQLADIFLGKIKNWSALGCPARPIVVAHRSDGSGTTFGFTNSLSCFSEEWKTKVGTGTAVNWPVGVGGRGNEGVAGLIQNTPGSIGYVNQAFLRGVVKPAALQNKAGKFVVADSKSGAAALNQVPLDERLGGEECNPAGEDSFPIVAFTWILAYQSGQGDDKAEAVRTFLAWALGEGPQKQAAELGFVPLTGDVLERAKAEVAKIKN